MDNLIKFLNKDYVGTFDVSLDGVINRIIKAENQVDGPKIKYNLNKFGFRSKTLKKFDKNEINILYSGCSNTWGNGVFEEEMWSTILTNKMQILYPNKIINANNIAYPGASIKAIIKNLLGVIQITGNPDYIFISFPNVSRDLSYSKGYGYFINCFLQSFIHLNPNETSIKYNQNFSYENNLLTATTMIFLLEEFCKSSNIKLVWTEWEESDDEIFKKINFNNYLKINKNYENKAIKTNSPYWEIAKDGRHPGAKWHLGLANYIFDNLKNEK